MHAVRLTVTVLAMTGGKPGFKYVCHVWCGHKQWELTAAPGVQSFDITYLKSVAKDVIDDVATTDCRSLDGIDVDGSLTLLSGDFTRLATVAVVPPGVKGVDFVPRAQTLAQFAQNAADDLVAGDTTDGYATYAVVRKETQPLLTMINKSLGTSYRYWTQTTC